MAIRNPSISMCTDENADRIVFVINKAGEIVDQTMVAANHRVRECAKQAYAKHGPCNVWILTNHEEYIRATGVTETHKVWRTYRFKNMNTGTHYKRQRLATVDRTTIPNVLKLASMLVGA